MYHNSFSELQVDYIDYMLLHGVGMGNDGMKEFEARYIDNGILEFLMEERRAGRIRNLGFSYHGDIKVFDYLLSRHDYYKWDFVQIQLNYLDWKHAKEINSRNTNAEYLYNELDKRHIPAIIMEPLLGGRLSKVHDHIVARFKQREPDRSVASWGIPLCRNFPERTDRTERNDLYRTPTRQLAFLFPVASLVGRRTPVSFRHGRSHDAVPDHTL